MYVAEYRPSDLLAADNGEQWAEWLPWVEWWSSSGVVQRPSNLLAADNGGLQQGPGRTQGVKR